MDSAFGLPLVELGGLAIFLEDQEILPWRHLEPQVPLEEYASRDLSESDLKEMRAFSPKIEVSTLDHPNGSVFHGFRTRGRRWAVVFTLLPGDLIPVVAGYLHGADSVMVTLPAGNLSDKDLNWESCAIREFTEETGILLRSVNPLSKEIFAAGGQSYMHYRSFLGNPRLPVLPRLQRLDDTEKLRRFLMPLSDWLSYLQVYSAESCSISTTYLALQQLDRLRIS